MNQESAEDPPKIIIDEDWKTQVQREKEELRQQEQAAEKAEQLGEQAVQQSPVQDAEGAESEQDALPPPPPASLPVLVTTMATRALAALGQFPAEDGKPLPVNLEYGRHFIDLLGVLEEKTAGNLTDEEKSMLEDTLHQMRMIFVEVSQQQGKS